MSKLLLKVLGHYNRELAALLARAEQARPALYADLDDALPEPEVEECRMTLLLTLTYLERLQRLLSRHTHQRAATDFLGDGRLLPPDIRRA